MSSSLGARLKLSHEYFESMQRILTVLHQVTATALGLSDINFFEEYYSSHSSSSGNALRFAHYPPSHVNTSSVGVDITGNYDDSGVPTILPDDSAVPRSGPRGSRYGAHTDYQGFTILYPDSNDWKTPDHGGLEVQSPSTGEWIKANLTSHRTIGHSGKVLIVNAGDLIQRWTNDYYVSAFHRVAGPRAGTEAAKDSRYSIVFFSGPFDEAVVSTLRLSYIGAPKYPPVSSGEHLKKKVERTHV